MGGQARFQVGGAVGKTQGEMAGLESPIETLSAAGIVSGAAWSAQHQHWIEHPGVGHEGARAVRTAADHR